MNGNIELIKVLNIKRLKKDEVNTKIKIIGGCVINVKSHFNNITSLKNALEKGIFQSLQTNIRE